MNPQEQSTNSSFTALSDMPPQKSVVSSAAGNILRNRQFQSVRFDELHSDSAKPEPKVVIHRNGQDIDSIEFVCRCGCSKTVRFDYDAD
ncbi:MAG: hypothetical protein KBF97_02720 [Bacteroidetes bacterium]|nr:hypothetical protein [Bacteroidota bacterium]